MTEIFTGNNSTNHLRAFVERLERLGQEKADLQGDIREVYAEAKGTGFDTKALREIVRMRRVDDEKRREAAAVLDTYLNALGML